MRAAWISLVPLILGGCQSTGPGQPTVRTVQYTRAVPIGQERNVGFFSNIHEDCTSLGPILVRVTREPTNGTTVVKSEQDYPNFSQFNPRSACNRQKVPGTAIYYRPNPGYSGSDSFGIDVITAGGATFQGNYTILVK